jgi:hypothetical protein
MKPQRAQLGESFGVELGLEAGVELVQRLVVRQAGELQPRRVAASFQDADFALEDEVEEFAGAYPAERPPPPATPDRRERRNTPTDPPRNPGRGPQKGADEAD